MWLVATKGRASQQVVEVVGEEFVVGRSDDCDLQLHDDNVSRRHAVLTALPHGRAHLRDLSSANGTFVDGERIDSVTLEGGEQLQFGDAVLRAHLTQPREGGVTRLGAELAPRGSQSAIVRAILSQPAVQHALERRSPRRLALAAVALVLVAAVGAAGASRLLGPEPVNTADVVAEVARSTALIEVLDESGERRGTGTGWVLDDRAGLVVTNAHVINQGAVFRVALGGRERQATVHAVAPCEDLAVLRVADVAGMRALALGTQRDLRRGDRVIAVGYPGNASLGDDLTSTEGIVSVVRTSYREAAIDVPEYTNVVQTDAAINPGNSGGPLVDAEGRLVGVNSAGRTVAPDGRVITGQSYAIGVDRVREILPHLRAGRSIAWTGIGFGYPTERVLEEQGLPVGLTVARVVPRSPAARAGLGQGRVIVVEVNGRPITNSLASYCAAVGDTAATAPLKLGTIMLGSDRIRNVTVAPAVADAS